MRDSLVIIRPEICLTISRCGQNLSNGSLYTRAFKEIGIHCGPQPYRIREHKIPEIIAGYQPLLDRFISFFGYFGHIRDIPVADIGTEHDV